jgi:hypothetical protein
MTAGDITVVATFAAGFGWNGSAVSRPAAKATAGVRIAAASGSITVAGLTSWLKADAAATGIATGIMIAAGITTEEEAPIR